MRGKSSSFSKIKILSAAAVLIAAAIPLSGCVKGENAKVDPSNTDVLESVRLPLELWQEEYLYEAIPAPENAQVYFLTKGNSDGWTIYSYSFEDFTFEEAEEYISQLESSLVKRERYDKYYGNDIPMINYLGYADDSLAVTISQSGEKGGMTISVKGQ